jgi:hypothetical protein
MANLFPIRYSKRVMVFPVARWEIHMRNMLQAIGLGISGLLLATGGLAGNESGAASGALPGDDALNCDQIYAQGLAESQRDQAERNRRNEERTAQMRGVTALGLTTTLTGGMLGTGPAAQAGAESLADRTLSEAATPPRINSRKEHLRQLWTQKHCVKK